MALGEEGGDGGFRVVGKGRFCWAWPEMSLPKVKGSLKSATFDYFQPLFNVV